MVPSVLEVADLTKEFTCFAGPLGWVLELVWGGAMVGCGGGSLRLIGSAPAGGAGFGADGMAPGGGAMPLGTVPAGGAVLNSAAPVGGAVLVGTGTGDAVPCGGTASCPVPIGSGTAHEEYVAHGWWSCRPGVLIWCHISCGTLIWSDLSSK